MIEEFNVNCKAECGRLNLAHVARNKKSKNEETEMKSNASVHLVRYRFKICGGSPEGYCGNGHITVPCLAFQ